MPSFSKIYLDYNLKRTKFIFDILLNVIKIGQLLQKSVLWMTYRNFSKFLNKNTEKISNLWSTLKKINQNLKSIK